MSESFKESALRYHSSPTPGKLSIQATKPLSNKRDLSRAYSPGVAYACEAIVEDQNQAAMMTARGNAIERRKGLALGADGFVAKPFPLDEFLGEVRQLLTPSPVT